MAPFVEFLGNEEAAILRRLESSGIHPEALKNPELPVPLEAAGRFVQASARHLGMDDFGLQVGSAAHFERFGQFGRLLARAPTLLEAIRRLLELGPVFNSGFRAELVRTSETTVELRARYLVEAGHREISAYGLMLFIEVVRTATGPNWRPKHVAIISRGRRPNLQRSSERYEALAEAVIDSHPHNTILEFPADLLALPIRHSPAQLSPAQNHRNSDPRLSALGLQIFHTVRSHLPRTPPTAESIAEMLDISPRTFQRRLAGEGLSYRALLDNVRFGEAIRLLADKDAKLADIAHQLGYNDAANFIRAFRRWTGLPPSQFRRTTMQSEWFEAPQQQDGRIPPPISP